MNLWHDIHVGKDAPTVVNVIVEINKGSKNKYEIDKETGLIALDRAMKSSQDYPFDYGFIPQTLWDDGDALDVILLTTYPLAPGILVRVHPIAIMSMIDGGDSDDKIIAVPVHDPRWDEVRDLSNINKHTIKEIQHFFSTYKTIENKHVQVTGFAGKQEAEAAIVRGQELYAEKFPAKS